MEKVITILNEQGLHARPASVFAKAANKFKSNISLVHGNNTINAKSIIIIMSLGLKKGEEIKIITKGEDEKEAMDALVNLIESKFGEE
jgi:phosphocarrier protein HPr